MRAISAADRPHLLPPSTETTQKKGKEREDKETFNNVTFRSAFSRRLVNTEAEHTLTGNLLLLQEGKGQFMLLSTTLKICGRFR